MRRTLALLFPLCLAPGLAFDWLSGLDWGGITQNVGRVGEVLRCDPGSLAQLDFSQPSLVFRGVYRVTKCTLCLTLKMCGFPDDMLYPATWGEVVSRFQAGREAMLVGSGAGVEALAQYLALAASGGGCQNISYGGVPIYTCPPGGASIPRGYVVTDGATARRVQERLRGLPNPGALKVVPVGGERDSPELHRVILGLPLLWIGETPYLFAPGYSTPDRWLWLTFSGPVLSKVAMVVQLATRYVASASRREEEVR